MNGMETSPIGGAEFDFIRRFIHERAGLVIDHNKRYLVEARMSQLLIREGIQSVEELVARVQSDIASPLSTKVVQAMTTNETYFFRDIHPFEALRKHLIQALIPQPTGIRPLSIWSGACSTGQEPYSIAMILKDSFPQLLPGGARIMASDISSEILDKAKAGIFNQIEVNRGLPAHLLIKHFQKDHDRWIIKPELKSMIEFFEINLNAIWPCLPQFDIVLLRNVMIYFDTTSKAEILKKVRQVMHPDGILILGGAETTLMIDDSFTQHECEKCVYYRLKGAKPLSLPFLPIQPGVIA